MEGRCQAGRARGWGPKYAGGGGAGGAGLKATVLLPLLQAGRVGFQQLRVLLVGSFHSHFKSKSKAEGVEGHSWLLQSPGTNDEDGFPADHKKEILPNLAVPQGSNDYNSVLSLLWSRFNPG